jgi:hypothetical protein
LSLLKSNFRVSHSYPSSSTQLWRPAEQQQQPLYNVPPPPPIRSVNIPRAPIFDADLIANGTALLKSRQPINDSHKLYDQTMVNNE